MSNKSIPTLDNCPTCKSKGFFQSYLPDQCTLCDGTEGGWPPTPKEVREAILREGSTGFAEGVAHGHRLCLIQMGRGGVSVSNRMLQSAELTRSGVDTPTLRRIIKAALRELGLPSKKRRRHRDITPPVQSAGSILSAGFGIGGQDPGS